jgi:hypothetical protein
MNALLRMSRNNQRANGQEQDIEIPMKTRVSTQLLDGINDYSFTASYVWWRVGGHLRDVFHVVCGTLDCAFTRRSTLLEQQESRMEDCELAGSNPIPKHDEAGSS